VDTNDAIGFVREVIPHDLVDLGQVAGAALAGVLIPRAELGKAKIGITDQFLRDARTYHERYSAVPYFRGLIEQATRGRLSVEPSIILDIGSGSGNSVLPCLELFPNARVIATDLSENLLAILRDHVAENPSTRDRLALVCMDATRPYFAQASVDMVIGAAILHHLIDPAMCIQHACRALKPGGVAVFFEPFENGNAIMRLAYEQILLRDSGIAADEENRIAPRVAACLRSLVEDYRVRAGCDKSGPIFQHIDDKWLFTRAYFENIAASLEELSLEIVPLNPSDHPFSLQTRTNLRLALGISEEDARRALPDWVWKTLYDYDTAFSSELKLDLPIEARVVFTRKADH
jgi:ubiquinone/menaquinone biosynthesis C-methylase UbiE